MTPSFTPDQLMVVIPILNAGSFAERQVSEFAKQGIDPACFLVIDSESNDGSPNAYRAFGAEVLVIDRSTFNHGGTRRFATEYRPEPELIVMLTQDAIPTTENTLIAILDSFDDPKVGLAYGRQMPRHEATAIERHARITNYRAENEVRTFEDRKTLGIKTVFSSDSFAAYRRSALNEVGGFPQDAYFAEDQILAGKMLMAGWSLAYRGDAPVIHSHDYSIKEEFQRYFDVGVFHARNEWLLKEFGVAEGEGMRFLKSEFAYLLREDPLSLPSAALRTFAKYIGYRLGRSESSLSTATKLKVSMQPFYWRKSEQAFEPTRLKK